ncbi:LuxR C-terminal-related transcriptional regulator [Cellulomonas sp. P22]|uniref:LuxR C-terminal-related transcriptional regulator n=1 Tax=Cellulomonas sp. P22 TaxID=3373189 RepID=UPI00378D9D42
MAGVVVCHGSTVVRERLVLTALGVPSLTPVRSASTAEELTALARRIPPTIVLLDAHLPGPGPVEAIRRLRSLAPTATIVMLAVPGDEVALDRAISIGARGYLAPDVGRAELSAVAAHVLASPAVPATAGPTAIRAESTLMDAMVETPTQRGVEEVSLTKREIEVLVGMSNGRSNSQIGAELFLSEDTVKTHARRLFRKLGAADRAQAVAIGLRRGLIR